MSFRGALTNRKLNGISVLNVNETNLEKINILFFVHFSWYKQLQF